MVYRVVHPTTRAASVFRVAIRLDEKRHSAMNGAAADVADIRVGPCLIAIGEVACKADSRECQKRDQRVAQFHGFVPSSPCAHSDAARNLALPVYVWDWWTGINARYPSCARNETRVRYAIVLFSHSFRRKEGSDVSTFLSQARFHFKVPFPYGINGRGTTSSRMNEVKMPPIMGAAMRFMTSEPVPVDHMMGRSPRTCTPRS